MFSQSSSFDSITKRTKQADFISLVKSSMTVKLLLSTVSEQKCCLLAIVLTMCRSLGANQS